MLLPLSGPDQQGCERDHGDRTRFRDDVREAWPEAEALQERFETATRPCEEREGAKTERGGQRMDVCGMSQQFPHRPEEMVARRVEAEDDLELSHGDEQR